MSWGDGIDWNQEARRAAQEAPPGQAASDMLVRLLGALRGVVRPRIVDCGCNIGRFFPQLSAAGFTYVGLDQADDAIRIAQARYPGARFEHAFLWDAWSRRHEPFDAALCNAVLQHNRHDEKARIVDQIAAAVRVDGVFVLQESTVPVATPTQLRPEQWTDLVETTGFRLEATWHRNEHGLDDAYLFRRV